MVKKNRILQFVGSETLVRTAVFAVVLSFASIAATPDYTKDLSKADRTQLAKGTECAYMTPELRSEFIKRCTKERSCPATRRVVANIKKGNALIDCRTLESALKTACEMCPYNECFKQAGEDLKGGDSRITRSPRGPSRPERVTKLTCTTFAMCPDTVPTFINNPTRNPVVQCDLDVARFAACQAIIENLFISGCLFFNYCNEIVFNVSDFGALFNDSCTGTILNGEPYRFAPAFKVFTDNIYPGSDCKSQLVAREVPPSGDDQTPLPFVDFCIPADYAPGNDPIEVDICFVVPCVNSTDNDIRFEVCAEFVGVGGGFINPANLVQVQTADYTIQVTSCVAGGPAFTYQRVTACIDSNLAQAGDIARLMFRRVAPAMDEYPDPVYVTSLIFRYPAQTCHLPVNAGDCP